MENSLKTGVMAVCAVSGSVVFLAVHAHKRLLSDFIKKIEFEMKSSTGAMKDQPKKKVRFAPDVAELTAKKAYGEKHLSRPAAGGGRKNGETLEAMPQNWQVLYKGILQYRNFRGGYN